MKEIHKRAAELKDDELVCQVDEVYSLADLGIDFPWVVEVVEPHLEG